MKQKSNLSKAEKEYLETVTSTENFLNVAAITEKYVTMQESNEKVSRLINHFCHDSNTKLSTVRESVTQQMSLASIRKPQVGKPNEKGVHPNVRVLKAPGKETKMVHSSVLSKKAPVEDEKLSKRNFLKDNKIAAFDHLQNFKVRPRLAKAASTVNDEKNGQF